VRSTFTHIKPLEMWLSARELAEEIEREASGLVAPQVVIQDWNQRDAAENDVFLREVFRTLLAESTSAETSQKLIAYDAAHCPSCDLGPFRKRLDARRQTKRKNTQAQLFVRTPCDPDGFNFGRVHPREKLVALRLSASARHGYLLLPNKFPLFSDHLLLVSEDLHPQQMTRSHLAALCDFVRGSSFYAYFNSWCGAASVNHFHAHVIGEAPPVANHAAFPLVPSEVSLVDGPATVLRPQGYPGECTVLPHTALDALERLVILMQHEEQPHNLLVTSSHVYLFSRPPLSAGTPPTAYPEAIGGPELVGSFTLYDEDAYGAFGLHDAQEALRRSTAPLPALAVRSEPLDSADTLRRELKAERARVRELEAALHVEQARVAELEAGYAKLHADHARLQLLLEPACGLITSDGFR
jgi:hypothetical protein